MDLRRWDTRTALAAGLSACLLAGQVVAQPAALWLLPRELRLREAPHAVPPGAPHLVALPAPRARAHVLFLHGWRGCARALVYAGPVRCAPGFTPEAGMGLGLAHLNAGTETTLLVPQLAFRARDGSAGRFLRRGYARDLIESVAPELGAAPELPVILMAHSAGYETALSVMHRGALGARVKAEVLFDALYGGTAAFLRWAEAHPESELISIHGRGRTARQSQRLRSWARSRDLAVARELSGTARIRTIATDVAHAEVPKAHLGDVLVHLAAGLPNDGPSGPTRAQERGPSP